MLVSHMSRVCVCTPFATAARQHRRMPGLRAFGPGRAGPGRVRSGRAGLGREGKGRVRAGSVVHGPEPLEAGVPPDRPAAAVVLHPLRRRPCRRRPAREKGRRRVRPGGTTLRGPGRSRGAAAWSGRRGTAARGPLPHDESAGWGRGWGGCGRGGGTAPHPRSPGGLRRADTRSRARNGRRPAARLRRGISSGRFPGRPVFRLETAAGRRAGLDRDRGA
jgi:hypothetical protein